MYGKQRVLLAKRAGRTGAWVTETFTSYGKAGQPTHDLAVRGDSQSPALDRALRKCLEKGPTIAGSRHAT